MLVTLKEAIEIMIEFTMDDTAMFVWGAPGVGKSDTVRWCRSVMDAHFYGSPSRKIETGKNGAIKKFGLVDIRLNQREPVDLRGVPYADPKNNVTRWLTPNELPRVDRDGERGYLFLDEMNTVNQQMQAPAMGLVLDRIYGDYKLPPGWIPIAAGNRLADKAAAQRVGTALNNRFVHIEVEPDLASWVEWANRVGVAPEVVAYQQWTKGRNLHVMPKGDEKTFPTPRSWEKVAKLVRKPERIRQKMIAMTIGEGPAAEVEGFIRMWTSLPDLEQIKKDPTRARVPTMNEASVMFAICAALARDADKATFDNILTYAGRLPKEFEISLCVDAVRRDPALQKTKAFAKWAIANQEVTI